MSSIITVVFADESRMINPAWKCKGYEVIKKLPKEGTFKGEKIWKIQRKHPCELKEFSENGIFKFEDFRFYWIRTLRGNDIIINRVAVLKK